jgi:phage/plasmid-associated DNA primase
MTTNYDWREPTEQELKTMQKLIDLIMPIPDEREAYLQILCTVLEGRCLEKFTIFQGSGGNGKGLINDLLMLSLGSYGFIANNGILFEPSKTGNNPEKANLHKKRLVIFREPPEKNKFQNSVIKELTGGGKFSARGNYDNETEKELHLTMIVECNKKPLFSEEPKDSEIRRIIDIYFRSTFTTDKDILDEKNNIYLADAEYKTKDFQDRHKYALIKILMEAHKRYKKNNYTIDLPDTIKERTKLYLELSCTLVEWFKTTYKKSSDSRSFIKIKDLFEKFTTSTYYFNLSKNEKKKYSKKYFIEYIKDNIFFRTIYKERFESIRNALVGWEPNNESDLDEE